MSDRDHDALLAAILAEPGDDLHRLAYADWLEENAREDRDVWRAGFVRAQVASAASARQGEEPDLGPERRLFAMLVTGSGSAAHLTFFDGDPVHGAGHFRRLVRCVYRRGFVAEARCHLAAWLEHGPALAAAHPLERVTLTDREPHNSPDNSGAGGGWYRWVSASYAERPYRLPAALWDAMEGGRFWPSPVRLWRDYATKQAAADALSAACIRWARRGAPGGAP